MVQMNLNFTPTRVAVFREPVHKGFVMIFGWIKICVAQRLAFIIPPWFDRCGVLLTPMP
jgi:hypothetical protein